MLHRAKNARCATITLLALLCLLGCGSDDRSAPGAGDQSASQDNDGNAGAARNGNDGGGNSSGDAKSDGEPDLSAAERAAAEAGIVLLSPQAHLTRASIALRGQRPAVDELEAVAEDPRYVEAIIDYYLTTDAFGITIRELHEEALLTGVDPILYPAGFPAIGALAGRELQDINRSITEAPLRLIEHVVMGDRPYSEIVTADYTLANDVVATVWGLAYDDEGEPWQETRYDDGRPSAGILSDSFLFTRHSTTFSNKSRGRANAVSRALLCYDFLARELPVDSGIDLADEAAVLDAVRNNPTCASCHDSLDPLAAYFASFYPTYVPAQIESYPFEVYEPTFRNIFSVTDPGYFGVAEGDLSDMGQAVAEDPRFTLCAARRFFGYLTQTDIERVPTDVVSELQAAFLDSGMDAKALAKAVVMSVPFRSSHVNDAARDDTAETLRGLKHVRPRQLARMVERLTGYRWRTHLPIDLGGYGVVGEVDLMEDAFFGFKVLAGGIDSSSVTRPSHTTNATAALVVEQLAARAADHVVNHDLPEPDRSRRKLLRLVEEEDDDPELLRDQLVDLQLRLYGETVERDDASVEDALALHQAARMRSGDGRRAWKLTLYAMLQDVRMTHY